MFGTHPFGSATYGSGPLGDPPDAPVSDDVTEIALDIHVAEAEAFDIPLDIHVAVAQTFDLPLDIHVAEAQTLDYVLLIIIQSPTVVSYRKWRPVVTLASVDVSEYLTGEISVEAEEGEAAVATFTLALPPGPVALLAWSGKPVTIDFAGKAPDGSAIDERRLFTGVVDLPDFDVLEGLVTFTCTDQLQRVMASLPYDWIEANIGGYYSEAVSGEITDALQYADARLASVSASLDLDPYQSPRVTPWHASDDPVLVFNEDAIFSGSLRFQPGSHSDVRNEIVTVFRYRYPRLRGRAVSVDFGGDISSYTLQALDIPNRGMIEGAVGSISGWTLLGEINYVPVEPGQYESSGSGGTIFIDISAADAPNLALGFAARFGHRWVQWVTEEFRITVRCQASIDALGLMRSTSEGATLDAEFDDGAWSADPTAQPALTLPPVGDVSLDYGGTGRTDRAAAQRGVETLVARAMREADASHRGTRVGASVPLNARITRAVRAEIDTAKVRAQGKVVRFRHRMDLDSGEHDTDFDIAVAGFVAVGLQDQDDIEAPAAPIDPTPAPGAASYGCVCGIYVGQVTGAPPWDEDNMIGYSTNAKAGPDYNALAEAYPYALSIQAPEVEAAVRDPITLTQPATYAVAIPQDTLEINNP